MKVKELIERPSFSILIVVLILANTFIMALDHYGISENYSKGLYITNMILTICFVIEMVLKIIGMGIKDYIRDGFNLFDAIVIIVGLLEYTGVGS